MLNRKPFYDSVRESIFGGSLTSGQVAGMDAILNVWELKYITRTPPTQLGYVLGTPCLETDRKMQPINEYGDAHYFHRMYDPDGARPQVARQLGNLHPGDGVRYHGRGFVQLTGLRNYTLATTKLQALSILRMSESLVVSPDLALRLDVASTILFEGMEDGWFTGADLDKIIDPVVSGDEYADYLKARSIINGADRAAIVAGYAEKFLTAIEAGMS